MITIHSKSFLYQQKRNAMCFTWVDFCHSKVVLINAFSIKPDGIGIVIEGKDWGVARIGVGC
jgi:hypothetical protein